jgi:hypothetical protein
VPRRWSTQRVLLLVSFTYFYFIASSSPPLPPFLSCFSHGNSIGNLADSIRALDGPAPAMMKPSAGAHLILPAHFVTAAGGATGMLAPHTSDGRLVFLLPWHGRALLGTTDTPAAASFNPVGLWWALLMAGGK